MDDFKHVKQYAQEVQSLYTTRDGILDAMYDMYKLIWDEQTYVESRAQFLKVTKSPDPRNAVLGIIRLLTTTAPHYGVSYDTNDLATMDVSSEIEKLATILIDAAGRVRGVPVLREAVRSAAIFGEVIMGVTQTNDLVKNVKGAAPAIIARAERVAKMTPYLYEVYDPRNCYPIWDVLGLRSFLHTSEVTAGEVIERFGSDAERALKSRRKRSITSAERVKMCDWWDLEQRVVWVEGGDDPVLQDKHGLPFIPYVCQVIEGSRMFRDPDEQRDPPLYTYYESGMWKRQCLALTAIFQGIAAMGLNPQFIHEKGPTNEAVNRDFSVPGGVIEVPQGSKFYPMANKGIIDPATMTGLEIAERKGAESTIYRQVLGEPLGDVAFSYVSLMSQQGRLPLVSIQSDVLRQSAPPGLPN